jgi:hypothetical protein
MPCKSFDPRAVDSLARKETIADSPHVYSEHSYKYYFSQWAVTKKIPGPVKDAAIMALGKRIRDSSRSTPAVLYNGQEINKKRLRRHISTAEKKKEEANSNIQLSSNVYDRFFSTHCQLLTKVPASWFGISHIELSGPHPQLRTIFLRSPAPQLSSTYPIHISRNPRGMCRLQMMHLHRPWWR